MPPPLSPLPIDPVLPELAAALRGHAAAVLVAPTGAGKTTRVPPALLDAGLAGDGLVVMLEPRRLAARAAARRMSQERGRPLGEEVGYHVRFDRQASRHTRVLVVTPGILLRMLHDDPYLESVGLLLFDEFHERGLEGDLALGMARLIQTTVRPELRLVVMSATLGAEAVAAYLGGAPVVRSEGRLFPVDILYEPKPSQQPWPVAAADGVRQALDRTPGDVLAFLPGMAEIRQAMKHLEPAARERDLLVLPLHGDLPPEQQDLALRPQPRRRVVLATNVAETSVTVEGVTAVVDTGLARVLRFDPHVGLDRLHLEHVSKASADQRAGRAGRTQPGLCLRLWNEAGHKLRPEQTEPEIRRVDLAGAALHLLGLGETDVPRFPWLEPPPQAAVAQALALLERLGAIRGSQVTPLGQVLARLPVHPRLGRLLVEGHRWGQARRAALAAALLAEKDPFVRGEGAPPDAGRPASPSDVLERVEALESYEADGRLQFPAGTLHRAGTYFLLRARDQLDRTLRQEAKHLPAPEPRLVSADEAVLRAILAAFPDRVARRREPGGRKARMAGGKGARLARGSDVTEAELFVCVDVDAGPAEVLVRQASAVERDWLPPDRVTTSVQVAFDPVTEQVSARRVVSYEDLTLDESPAPLPGGDAVAVALAAAAAERLDRVLPEADSPAGRYLLRWRCLRDWLPDLGLPPCDDDHLRELLPWLCARGRSLEDVRRADWLGALQGRLTYHQQQALEREAPDRLEVPSGSRVALHYERGRPPVLAVRIQEVFGLRETPRVAAGRVPVLLHLLAPNYRPQQVTDDLASFWANTYPQVRKELRARYPKHAWPDDPLAAPPQRGPRRRP